MKGCCEPEGYNRIFGGRFARRVAARYRKRGLDRTAQRMAAFLEGHGLAGASVLEIGGGVGEVEIELLRRGAARATCLELVSGYDGEAQRLANEAGVADRITRRHLDIVADPSSVEPADIVVLHRVVCCYPDYERLLAAAADHARSALVFSHPPRNVVSRTFMVCQNAFFRLTGNSFRGFVHPPAAMVDVLTQSGLRLAYAHRGPVWHVVGLERA